MPNLHLLVLILSAALIVIGKWYATPPFDRWAFGAGVFVGVVWVILVIASFLGIAMNW